MGAHNKFLVAILMMIGNGIRSHYGIDLGVDEAMATSIAGGMTAALVWLVPNR